MRHFAAIREDIKKNNIKMIVSRDHDEGSGPRGALVTLTPGIKGGDPGRFLSCPGLPHEIVISSLGINTLLD